MSRARLRDLGISIGRLPPGPQNAITDVPGVWVGHTTLIYDEPRVARTGVTVIVPEEGAIWQQHLPAGFHIFNGNGEMTGLAWLEEAGLLTSPIALTNTHQVGMVRDALVAYAHRAGIAQAWDLPVVAETYDGWLNDIEAFHLGAEHLDSAMAAASPGPVAEGNVGGGTGTICHEFKGGIGTASRHMELLGATYHLGALVQANYGLRHQLRLEGVPIGQLIDAQVVPTPQAQTPGAGSILVVLATDAPLIPLQCRRLARRATVGLARAGGLGHNSSGDLFLAFSTGNRLASGTAGALLRLEMLPHGALDSLFEAAAEATEEAILNSLTAAETLKGKQGRVAHELPLDQLATLWNAARQGTANR